MVILIYIHILKVIRRVILIYAVVVSTTLPLVQSPEGELLSQESGAPGTMLFPLPGQKMFLASLA